MRSSHRRFDNGDVLLRRSAADSDAGDDLAFAGDWHAAAHRGVSTAGDGEERVELRAWLHEGDEVSGADADERGRVGLSLGELERKCGRSGDAVDENDVAVGVDDGNRDGYVCLNDSASTRSAMSFAMVSKSMVVCFLSDSEMGRSGFSARRRG